MRPDQIVEQRMSECLLTTRQKQVCRMVFAGKQSKEIAETLGISASSVNNQLREIFARAGVRGRPSLIARWLRLG